MKKNKTKKMEGRPKKCSAPRVRAPLGLERLVPIRDVRRLIWKYLTPHDREVARCAMNSCRVPQLETGFAEYCAKRGFLRLLEWGFGSKHVSLEQWACRAAAEGGQLAVLQWLREMGCPWDAYTCHFAALYGHLDVLKWARANGCGWGVLTCTYAAIGGHLAVLQWARAAGCHWNSLTCSEAAGAGHLTILQWARANGCPWDEDTVSYARYNHHVEVAEWARANGCPE
jgi:hypothetical protein